LSRGPRRRVSFSARVLISSAVSVLKGASFVWPASFSNPSSLHLAAMPRAHPGLEVVLTVNFDGEVEGFEVHTQGTERSFPIDRGEYGPRELPPPPDPVEPPPITAALLRALPFGELARLARSPRGQWRQGLGRTLLGSQAVQWHCSHADTTCPPTANSSPPRQPPTHIVPLRHKSISRSGDHARVR
jgi:hypothetical protein